MKEVFITGRDVCDGYDWHFEIGAVYATEQAAQAAVARCEAAQAVVDRYWFQYKQLGTTEARAAFEEAHPDYKAAKNIARRGEERYCCYAVEREEVVK